MGESMRYYLNYTIDELNEILDKSVVKIENITTENPEIKYEYLPNNNKEIRISSTIKSIEFTNLTEEDGGISTDYWVLFIFQKDDDILSPQDLLINSEIKILNPDVDIATYSVIHLLFSYDGFNICALVAGY